MKYARARARACARGLARACSALALILASLPGAAHDYKAGALSIKHPYAHATVDGQPTGIGFMKFENGGMADRLISASAPVSESVQLHRVKMEGGSMRMRRVESLDLPAASTVTLEPGGLHMMFVGLRAPLKAGMSFPLELRFERAGAVVVKVVIEAVLAAPEPHKH